MKIKCLLKVCDYSFMLEHILSINVFLYLQHGMVALGSINIYYYFLKSMDIGSHNRSNTMIVNECIITLWLL